MILSKLGKPYDGSSLARIAVEVGEEEDIRRLVQSGSVDWNETAKDEYEDENGVIDLTKGRIHNKKK